MSSDNPLEPIARGATEGVLEWTSEKIKELVQKFKDGELSFIEDEQSIETAKTVRRTPEFELYRKYLKDKELRLQVVLGLTLRKLDGTPNLKNLRDKIRRKWGTSGLHAAQTVQLGIFKRLTDLLLGNVQEEKELEDGMYSILKEIDKYVWFVKAEEDVETSARTVVQRINVNAPKAYVIFSRGFEAMVNADKIFEYVKAHVLRYRFEEQNDYALAQRYNFAIALVF